MGHILRRPARRQPALLTTLVVSAAATMAFALPVSSAIAAGSPSVFVNEIHYDNIGEDKDEGIELAGPAGADLSSYSIELYNGYDQKRYATISLTGSLQDQENGFGTKFFPIPGLQNGAPDGIALVGPEAVEQTLGYEGTFTGIDGSAAGLVFADIRQFEAPSTPIGQSLQLQGSGTKLEDFSWHSPIAATPNEVNTGQHFVEVTASPENVSPPTISGTPAPGEALSCAEGSWEDNPTSFAYQWNRDGSTIAEATSASYTVLQADAGHALTCTVTASNVGGSASATSVSVEVPAEEAEEPGEEAKEEDPAEESLIAPLSTALPTILGTATLGEALSCVKGSWGGGNPSSVVYQWSQDGGSIAGATGVTYVVRQANVGHTLSCTVTASNPAGSASATSLGVEVEAVEVGVGRVGPPFGPVPAGPAVASAQGSSGAGGSADPRGTAARTTRAQIAMLLRRQLAAVDLRAGRLSRYGVLSIYFGIPEPATLVVRWYARGQSARGGAAAKRVVVASGRGRIGTSGGALVEIKLSRAGRDLLKHTTNPSVIASATLTPVREPAISVSRTFSLRRQ